MEGAPTATGRPNDAADPGGPLPGPPEPWAPTAMPSPRGAPPWRMTEMIAAEPALAERIVGRVSGPGGAAEGLAAALRSALARGGIVLTTGCGTSEHAALGAAEILREAALRAGLPAGGRLAAGQALEVALDPGGAGLGPGSLLIAVSHEGATAATNRALRAARSRGAVTALVTAGGRSPGAGLADLVLATGELDASWCHTVGYLSPLVAAAAVGAALVRETLDAAAVRSLLAAGAAQAERAEELAAALAGARELLVVASGADRPAARELVLKVEEATWLPSAMRDLETLLHGHLPATGSETGLVLILADRAARPDRLARARQAPAAAAAIGLRAGAILARDADPLVAAELTPAGRLLVDEAPALPAAVAALLGTAAPLQLLAEHLARARGTDPDPIRRDDPRYREAAAAAGD